MSYDQLIQLYFERSNALQWYWTLYVVIVGGLLAFSSLRQRGDLLTTLLVTILFSCFAYKNLGAIHDTTLQRLATLQSIQQFPPAPATIAAQRQLLESTLAVPTWESVRNFHITSDLLTLLTLWAMERRRKRTAPSPAA